MPFTFAITHSLITANPTMLNLSSIIYHLSSMATPNIKLTQFPMLWFSQYSVDSPPHFTHLLIQSNDPVLKMTHTIGDKVQFETYSAPCVLLGMKWTAPVDNEVWKPYEAEFGVTGISSSSAQPPWSFISNFKIKSREIVFIFPLVFYHRNGSRISFRLIAVYNWSFIQRWLTIWSSMTHSISDEDI